MYFQHFLFLYSFLSLTGLTPVLGRNYLKKRKWENNFQICQKCLPRLRHDIPDTRFAFAESYRDRSDAFELGHPYLGKGYISVRILLFRRDLKYQRHFKRFFKEIIKESYLDICRTLLSSISAASSSLHCTSLQAELASDEWRPFLVVLVQVRGDVL